MFRILSSNPIHPTTSSSGFGKAATPQKLAEPLAPTGSVQSQPTLFGKTFAQLGAIMGRVTMSVVAATMGASVFTGCASMGPYPPPVEYHAATQYVSLFERPSEGEGWVLKHANEEQVLPERFSTILDHVIGSRATMNGNGFGVVDGRFVGNPWEHTELTALRSTLGELVESGAIKTIDNNLAFNFLMEIATIKSEAGPGQHSGWGVAASVIDDINDHIRELDRQRLE